MISKELGDKSEAQQTFAKLPNFLF